MNLRLPREASNFKLQTSKTLFVMVAVLLFAAFMHLYLIGSYPPGLDSDAATDGLDSLKFTRYGITLFYIVINAKQCESRSPSSPSPRSPRANPLRSSIAWACASAHKT
ncbi:MAG: hypothetical protein HZB77_12345 [Chloroflexi bacterium]|nr:hypothetical protein [Chloroflexota bacterium]